jgi:hypothetical protein
LSARHSLVCHPDFPCDAVTAITVAVTRERGRLSLDYIAEGQVGDVRLPLAAEPVRTNELWKHTCMEAFVRPAGGTRYCELNFAPSGQWAAYLFDDIRDGMRDALVSSSPPVSMGVTDRKLWLRAQVGLDLLQGFAHAPWKMNVTAVIEEMNGRRSYWSLKHPAGRPDFHHSDGFVLEVPAASGT